MLRVDKRLEDILEAMMKQTKKAKNCNDLKKGSDANFILNYLFKHGHAN